MKKFAMVLLFCTLPQFAMANGQGGVVDSPASIAALVPTLPTGPSNSAPLLHLSQPSAPAIPSNHSPK